MLPKKKETKQKMTNFQWSFRKLPLIPSKSKVVSSIASMLSAEQVFKEDGLQAGGARRRILRNVITFHKKPGEDADSVEKRIPARK